MKISDKKKRAIILEFVKKERKNQGIESLPGPRPEPSCFMFGEFHNCLWFSLMYTPDYNWHELKNKEVLDGVYKEVIHIIKYRKKQKKKTK